VLNLAPPRTRGGAVLAINHGLRGEVVKPTKLRRQRPGHGVRRRHRARRRCDEQHLL